MAKVWSDLIDRKFDCYVERVSPYRGRLIVRDGETVLLDEPVGISYNAPFGPDVADVDAWTTRAIEIVDAFVRG